MFFKTKKANYLIFILILICFFWGTNLFSDEADIAELNNIIINEVNREIIINVKTAIKYGILEFLLVDERGKTYESVFKLANNKPSELHFALLLLGFEPTPFPVFYELLEDTNALSVLKNNNSLLNISILKNDEEIDWDYFLFNRQEGKIEKLVWVFTGSGFTKDKNQYIADLSLNYISIWRFPDAVINLFSVSGNPYRGNYGYEINRNSNINVDEEYKIKISAYK